MTVHNRAPKSPRYTVDYCGNVENDPQIGPQRRVPASNRKPLVENPVDHWGDCPHRDRFDVGDSVIHISTRLATTTIPF